MLVGATLALVSVAFVLWTGMRPNYDPYGWLVWGHQSLHWSLNTDGAPSWKPLTFLFTLPYSLLGGGAMWLWMVTAVAGGFAACVCAARIAYALIGPCPRRRWAPFAGAAFAAAAVLSVDGYWNLMLVAESDPLIVALLLGAIDAHLCGRSKLAFGLLVLAALGRPEAWLFVGLYGLWAVRAHQAMRMPAAAGLALIPILWFSVPALTSKSWLTPGDLALNSVNVIHGSKITGVLDRFLGLTELPITLAALVAFGLALLRRDRGTLLLAASAVLWVVLEIGFALHGWSAGPRYLVEPAAVVAVLAGTAVGWLLTLTLSGPRIPHWAGGLAVVVLLASLVSPARTHERRVRRVILDARAATTRMDRLVAVIARDGGRAGVLVCGQPVSVVGYQSTLAYYLGLNVSDVDFQPGRAIGSGKPIVLFKPDRLGWQVRPIHIAPSRRAHCKQLTADTSLG
ncbi:MAG: hypothetical protein QOD66_2157 [Solirubrobacteraceae bacterium]|nr:hypothetical protein [Solirubrobacteraceae bacterium]